MVLFDGTGIHNSGEGENDTERERERVKKIRVTFTRPPRFVVATIIIIITMTLTFIPISNIWRHESKEKKQPIRYRPNNNVPSNTFFRFFLFLIRYDNYILCTIL